MKLKPAKVGDLVRWRTQLNESPGVGVVVEKQGVSLKVWWSGPWLLPEYRFGTHLRAKLEVISKA